MAVERRSSYDPGAGVLPRETLNRMHNALFRVGQRKAEVYDRLTREVIERACGPRTTGVDVGAAVGEILGQIVAAAPQGRHHAFEPVPRWAAALRRDFPGVHVWEAAASDAEGTATFSVVTSSPFQSGLRPRATLLDSDEQIELVTVRTARLDDVIPADDPVGFLKIDVEGAEVQVLRGAAGLIRRCRPVVVLEHGGLEFTKTFGTTTDDLWSVLVDELGYALYDMAGWLAGRDPLRRADLARALLTMEFQFVAAAQD